MNTFRKCVVALSVVLTLSSHAQAEPNEAADAQQANGEPGVVVKVEKAIERGAKAAASGVERGAKAAAGGIKRGAKAAARGVEKGANATAKAASDVANKIDGEPASSPSSEK